MRRSRLLLSVALAAPLLGVLVAGAAQFRPAGAQETNEPASELEDVRQQLERKKTRAAGLAKERESLRQEIAALRQQAIAAAREAQDLEGRLDAIEYTLAALRAEETRLDHSLDIQRRQLTETLAALQRVALLPPESLLGQPGEPLDLARGAMLLGVAVPAIEARAIELRRDLETLAELHQQIDEQRQDLGQAASRLADERAKLGSLVERKQALEAETGADQEALEQQVAKLADEAQSLRELIERLNEARKRRIEQARRAREAAEQAAAERAAAVAEARARAETARAEAEAADQAAAAQGRRDEAPRAAPAAARPDAGVESQVAAVPSAPPADLDKPDGLRPFDGSAHSLVMPVRGRIARRFGEPAEGNWESVQGMTLTARPGSTVVAPYDGRIVYAGPFRSYGLILIIEHGDEYHSLVAGFDRLTAVVGQWVLAGEPVGTLSEGAGSDQRLYLELRKRGEPINPLPLLATGDDKARG